MCLYLLRLFLSVYTVLPFYLSLITRRIHSSPGCSWRFRLPATHHCHGVDNYRSYFVSLYVFVVSLLGLSGVSWAAAVVAFFVVGTDSVPCSYVHATTTIARPCTSFSKFVCMLLALVFASCNSSLSCNFPRLVSCSNVAVSRCYHRVVFLQQFLSFLFFLYCFAAFCSLKVLSGSEGMRSEVRRSWLFMACAACVYLCHVLLQIQ
jgi:hypothetical protein